MGVAGLYSAIRSIKEKTDGADDRAAHAALRTIVREELSRSGRTR